jgi:hypothetical protein
MANTNRCRRSATAANTTTKIDDETWSIDCCFGTIKRKERYQGYLQYNGRLVETIRNFDSVVSEKEMGEATTAGATSTRSCRD